MMTAVVLLALVQSAEINSKRDAFLSCLKEQVTAAKAQNVAGDAFEAQVRAACSASAEAMKAELVKFDVKNKISRKQASEDAQFQIDDFVGSSVSDYKRRAAATAK